MADTYFATFCLGEPGEPPPPLAAVATEVVRWLQLPRHGVEDARLKGLDLLRNAETRAGDAEVVSRHVKDDAAELLGIRFRHPDRVQTDVEWMSEIVIARTGELSPELRVSIRTGLRRTGSLVAPIKVPASRPRLVCDLISKFGAYEGGFKLVETALPVTAADFDRYFVEALIHERRTVPLVVITTTGADQQLVNGDVIANSLAGVALVCAFENRFVGWRLTSRLGHEWSCWDGGIRVYWPGADVTRPPNDHVVFSRRRIEELGGDKNVAEALLGIVSRAATSRSAVGIARWSELDRRVYARRLDEARERGDSDELVRLLMEEKESLALEKLTLEDQLQLANANLERAREDAAYWRREWEGAQRQRPTTSNEGQDASEPPPPRTAGEALQQMAAMYPERLEVHPNSSSDPETPFVDLASLTKALKFLATTYVDARSGAKPCADLDGALKEYSGFFYKAGQSGVTMGQFKNEYETTVNGRRITLEEHIGKGTNRDPRRSIRIAFFFDRTKNRVIVGYIGQHQSTAAS